jgi:programmed cell death 6-interacting protein
MVRQTSQFVYSLNLPASLEALEKPIGMPPSLLKKAEEVRTERGPEQIDRMLEDIQRLSQSNRAKLMEVSSPLYHSCQNIPD